LIDFAFAWNERWVAFSLEMDEAKGGNFWLAGLLIISCLGFAGAISAMGVMFWQFSGTGCDDNNAILSLTVILCFIVTMAQIFGSEHGSLLTSAIMTCYATYVCFSAVTLNPSSACNPTLSTGYQTVSQVI
jgi:hypothetical protein